MHEKTMHAAVTWPGSSGINQMEAEQQFINALITSWLQTFATFKDWKLLQ